LRPPGRALRSEEMVVNRNFHFDFAIDLTIYAYGFLEAIAMLLI
jgi:hypothetical protein